MSAPESSSEDPLPPKESISTESQNTENHSQDDPTMTEDDAKTPKVGMKFNSYDELYEFYTNYAREMGFVTMKRRNKCEDGVLRYFTLACARSGMPRNPNINPTRGRRSIKIGCKARINATLGQDGLFFLSLVEIDHNHLISPSEVRLLYRGKKCIDAQIKKPRIPSGDGNHELDQNHLISPSEVTLYRGKKRIDAQVKKPRIPSGDGNHEIDPIHLISPSEVTLYRGKKRIDAHVTRIPAGDGNQMMRYNQLKACFDHVAVIGSQSEYLCERAKLYISDIVNKLKEDEAMGENQQDTQVEFLANGDKDDIESSNKEKKPSFIETNGVKIGEDCSQ